MIGATLAMAALAVLFVVFGAFRLADGRGCHGCPEEGTGDCHSCPWSASEGRGSSGGVGGDPSGGPEGPRRMETEGRTP